MESKWRVWFSDPAQTRGRKDFEGNIYADYDGGVVSIYRAAPEAESELLFQVDRRYFIRLERL